MKQQKNVMSAGRQGFAQIPLMIGLLLMAVAIPAVTSLVQNIQDTRNKASYGCSETTRPSSSCVLSGKTYGWTCNANGIWKCVMPAPVTPVAIVTLPVRIDCNNGKNKDGSFWCAGSFYTTCNNGRVQQLKNCGSAEKCDVNSGNCITKYNYPDGTECILNSIDPNRDCSNCGKNGYHFLGNAKYACGSMPIINEPTPTNVPTVTKVPTLTPTKQACVPNGNICFLSETNESCSRCCNGYGKGRNLATLECGGDKIYPTAIPTVGYRGCNPACWSPEICVHSGSEAGGFYSCVVPTPTPTKIVPTTTAKPTLTSVPTAKYGCSPLGYHCVNGDSYFCHSEGSNSVDEFSEDCGSRSCVGGMCVEPTATPIKQQTVCCCYPGITNQFVHSCGYYTSTPNQTLGYVNCGIIGKSNYSDGYCKGKLTPTSIPTSITPTAVATITTTVTRTPTAIPTMGKILCGSAAICKNYNPRICELMRGDSAACTTESGSSGNCCLPKVVVPTTKPTAVPTTDIRPTSYVLTTPTIRPRQPTSNPGTGMCRACPSEFRCYSNGTALRWFVNGYVMSGFSVTNNSKCTSADVLMPTYKGKSKGDANCDGRIDTGDYAQWHTEFYLGKSGAVVKKNWYADFTGPEGVCDGKVDELDHILWKTYFYELMGIK